METVTTTQNNSEPLTVTSELFNSPYSSEATTSTSIPDTITYNTQEDIAYIRTYLQIITVFILVFFVLAIIKSVMNLFNDLLK